jgi:hypothetical protein
MVSYKAVFSHHSGLFKSSIFPPSAGRRKEFCEDTSRSGKGLPPSALRLGGDFYITLPTTAATVCYNRAMLRTLTVTRYVTPLREGGSLPAIVEADDDGLYVLKFRGAGQGEKALIAELLAGELGRALGLPVPEIVFMELDPVLGRSEPDYEIQSLIKASAGLNLGLDYLPGALAFTPLDGSRLEPLLASSILWFDAYVTNVDRTPRNTNMLFWHRRLMLIDHGSALYFHYSTGDYLSRSRSPFPPIKEHVLLPVASALEEADVLLKEFLTPRLIQETVKAIPDSWLDHDPFFADRDAHREAYQAYLLDRLAASHSFVEEALRARAQLL